MAASVCQRHRHILQVQYNIYGGIQLKIRLCLLLFQLSSTRGRVEVLIMSAVYESLLPKLVTVLEVTQQATYGAPTQQVKQALVQAVRFRC